MTAAALAHLSQLNHEAADFLGAVSPLVAWFLDDTSRMAACAARLEEQAGGRGVEPRREWSSGPDACSGPDGSTIRPATPEADRHPRPGEAFGPATARSRRLAAHVWPGTRAR